MVCKHNAYAVLEFSTSLLSGSVIVAGGWTLGITPTPPYYAYEYIHDVWRATC
jgi:hypothetical protein